MRTSRGGRIVIAVSAALVLMILAASCSRPSDKAIPANIIALHDTASPQFNGDCLSCHKDVTKRTTLDPKIKDAHAIMMPFVPGYSAAKGATNETCNFCHKGVDLRDHSSAGIRKEVSPESCALCHGPAGPGLGRSRRMSGARLNRGAVSWVTSEKSWQGCRRRKGLGTLGLYRHRVLRAEPVRGVPAAEGCAHAGRRGG